MTEKTLKIIGWSILVMVIIGLLWSIFRNKTEPIKDVFTPAPKDNWSAPVQSVDGKG